jgi:hypothetical protein
MHQPYWLKKGQGVQLITPDMDVDKFQLQIENGEVFIQDKYPTNALSQVLRTSETLWIIGFYPVHTVGKAHTIRTEPACRQACLPQAGPGLHRIYRFFRWFLSGRTCNRKECL